MKKGYIFLAFIVCIWSSLSENVYYVGKDGTVLNLGKSESTVSRWCTNEIQPSVETLAQIAQLLKVDIKEFLNSTTQIQ